MFPESGLQTPPKRLFDYIRDNADLNLTYRQRAVCTKHGDNSWHLVCCAVEAFSKAVGVPEPQLSRAYGRAIFFERWYDAAQCLQLIDEAQSGRLQFGEVTIERVANANWQSEILPSSNMYMRDAGLMARTRIEMTQATLQVDFLIGDGLPFYSDAEKAAREWLSLKDYHGQGDGRNNDVLFLLPQFRARFTSANWAKGALRIGVSGSDVGGDPTLSIKGNYQLGSSQTPFERRVERKGVSIAVPHDAQQAEFILQNSSGTIFDYQLVDIQAARSKQRAHNDDPASSYEIPAADRIVRLDHNSTGYRDMHEAIDVLIVNIRSANDFDNEDDKKQSLTDLSAGKTLLQGARVHLYAIGALIVPTLLWLADKFADGVIGSLAESALQLFKRFIGL